MFDDDPRWGNDPRARDDDPRDLDTRDRDPIDPRDVFMRDLDLPHDLEREHVHTLDHDYTLRDSETRTLSIVGAFRSVLASDLRDTFGHTRSIHARASCGTCANKVWCKRINSIATPPS